MMKKLYRSLRCPAWLLVLLSASALADIPTLSWTLLRSIPRQPDHFTQGLVYVDRQLFESTGRYGASRLIAYDASTMKQQQSISLHSDVFGEGLTFLHNRLYQCSWTSEQFFIYSTALQLLQTMPVRGECWGLTSNGRALIMSNGSDTLQFLDPASGQSTATLTVRDSSGKHWRNINELEWIDGKILANIWHENIVLLIDSESGLVLGQFDFKPLAQQAKNRLARDDSEQVLNGIAWHPQNRTLLITGKDWPLWFELKITLH